MGSSSPRASRNFVQLHEEWLALEQRRAYYNEQLEAICQADPAGPRLLTIPGVGPFTATALVAAVSDATHFKNGRQFAAWLGLGPRQHSTGGQPRLLGISKRGDLYRRKLFVHGARATLRWVGLKNDRRSEWLRALMQRRGTNRAVVALAHKNARIAWVLLATDQVYTPAYSAA
jgi:transposase